MEMLPPIFSAESKDRLDSWKEIASYLGRSERTVRRWEKTERLPVHRHRHHRQDSVYASKKEIDEWLRARSEGSGGAVLPERRRITYWPVGAGIVGLVALGAVLVAIFSGREEQTLVSQRGPYRAVPLTSYQGVEQHPSFSPAGDQVAFSWGSGGEYDFDIYVKTIGVETPRRITTHPAPERGPVWSPDGRFLAFLRVLGPRADLIMIPAEGGAERVVTQVRSPHRYIIGDPGPFLAWVGDGEHVIFFDQAPGSDASALYLYSLETSEKRQMTSPPAAWRGDSAPVLSPDGQGLAFVRSYDISSSEIYTLRLSPDLTPRGDPRPLTRLNRSSHSPAWTPDGREIVFGSGLWDAISLWICPAEECAEPTPLTGAGEDAYQVTISPATGMLAYTRFAEDRDIWRIDLRESHPVSPRMSPLITSTRRDMEAYYSPDGNSIVFVSTRSGSLELWICDPDGSNPRQVTDFGGAPSGSPRWSPDGRRIVFDNPAEGQMEIFVTDWQGGSVRRLTHDPAADIVPTWSSDGRWVYFCSRRGGTFEIWKIPAEGGEAIQVTHHGGFRCRESLDGRFLYYIKSDDPVELWRMPVEGGEETVVIESVWRRHWDLGKSGIFYQERVSAEERSILFRDFKTGETRVVVPDPGDIEMSIGIAPDEQALLVSKPAGVIGDLMIVEVFYQP